MSLQIRPSKEGIAFSFFVCLSSFYFSFGSADYLYSTHARASDNLYDGKLVSASGRDGEQCPLNLAWVGNERCANTKGGGGYGTV